MSAYAAVISEGSFEGAARRLSVTPSAISQRIRSLENRLGQVLVVRETPCRPTATGKRLLKRLQPMQALEAEALAELLPEEAASPGQRSVAIAVNDDSLQTWLLDGLARLHRDLGITFDVRVDDQDHTLEYLRDGSVSGAVTSEGKPLQACKVHLLGAMRYFAIASPEFAREHFPGGFDGPALNRAPIIIFNRKDELQWRYVRQITRSRITPPLHYLPTALGFVEAAAQGLGWCLAPEQLISSALRDKRVVIIDPARWLDLALYWQQTTVKSRILDDVGRGLRAAAHEVLRH